MLNINREKAEGILKRYNSDKSQHELFNWCEEYNNFIISCVNACLSYEVDYMLKKSYEDKDSPLSYEDIDLFDIYKAREHILYEYDSKEEEFKTYSNNPDTFNKKVINKGDFEVFLNSLNNEELKTLFQELNLDENDAQREFYEWWIISDPLKYRLEQQGEIFIKGACCEFWGRCTTGQGIGLDNCCIKGFIALLEDIIKR